MNNTLQNIKTIFAVIFLTVFCSIDIVFAQHVLQGNVPKVIAQQNLQPTGNIGSTKQLVLSIGLPLQHQAELDNLLQDMYDPTSPNFRKYLTTEQFTNRFGPSEQDYQAVIDFATANGLTVTGTHKNRMLVDIKGSVQTVEHAFNVKMKTYKHPKENRSFYAPDQEPTVPSSLQVLDIDGLNNYSLPKPKDSGKKIRLSTQNANGSAPDGSSYWGNDFRAAYMPDVSPALRGTGQYVGLIEFNGYLQSDIEQYIINTGLQLGVRINSLLQDSLLDGFDGLPRDINDPDPKKDQREVTLDIDMAISMAPGLYGIIVYESYPDSGGSSTAWHRMLNKMANDNKAKQLSCSWGTGGSDYDVVADQIFQQMASQGQSFFNATGDDGAYTSSDSLGGFPDGSPYITQVGGTDLTTSSKGGPWSSEQAWHLGGGGIGTTYSIPYYQQNIQNINASSNQGSKTMRNIPDVSLVADNIYTYCNGTGYAKAGTSYAAPLWAGIAALINQQASANGDPTVGFLNPVIYLIGQSSTAYANDFNDIEDGSNNFTGASQNRFYTVPSYDLCTGWGTPKGQSFINDILSLRRYAANAYQYLSDGATAVDSIGYWQSTKFNTYKAPASLTVYTDLGATLRGTQNKITASGTTQKYNYWSVNANASSDVTNHHTFDTQKQPSSFTSNLIPVSNATVQAQFIDGGSPVGYINFKDPWLIDSTDALHANAPLNRGMTNAIFHNVYYNSHVAYNIGTSTIYNGVFLNQNPLTTPTYYSVSAPSTQPITVNGLTFTGVFQNWSGGSNATFQNANTQQTPVVFSNANAIATANYKGIHLSSTASTFSNNSQKKLVRTWDGWYHQVYESMGHVWLEESTDGTNWFLGNNGQPLDNGGGKCPSIDWHYNCLDPNNTSRYAVVVAYQQPAGNTYTIQYKIFLYQNGNYVYNPISVNTLYTEPTGGDSYSVNANPNIAWGNNYSFVLCFERKSTAGGYNPGIYWIYGNMVESGVKSYPIPPSAPQLMAGTSSSSTNASIALNKKQPTNCYAFYIVYQTGTGGNSNINYIEYSISINGNSFVPSVPRGWWGTASGGSGYLNYQPSMVQMPDNTMRVCWIRDLYGDGSQTPYNVNAVYWDIEYPSVFTYSGNMVNSISLDVRDDNVKTYYGYAQHTNNTTWENYASDHITFVKLNTTGQYVQLSNGPATSSMSTSSFYSSSLPYYFQNTAINTGGLMKEAGNTASVQPGYGRGMTAGKGAMQFSYSLKNLTVNNTAVPFVDIPANFNSLNGSDTVKNKSTLWSQFNFRYPKIDTINTVLCSKPFSISNGNVLAFNEQAGFMDSVAALAAFGSTGYLSYKVELIDQATNASLGVIRQAKFSSSYAKAGQLSSFKMNAAKIGSRTAYLKMIFTSNIDSLQTSVVNEYTNLNDYSTVNTAPQVLTLASTTTNTAAVLDEAYPNPFNPTTTIAYQIPTDGHVAIKVFDVLGRDVSTLVDEFKPAGSYTVRFDASRLASGIYFYSIRAGDYNAVKKMLLLK